MKRRAPPTETCRSLDRTLSLPILESVYRVAALDKPLAERYELLTIALRDHVPEKSANNQMKKAVTRIWLNPPEDAAPMIRWALDHPDAFPDRRVMHAGSLIATVPYVGSIFAQLGRSFALDEPLTIAALVRRVVAIWGASSTVRGGVGKTVTTLRRLDVVHGGGRTRITRAVPLETSPLGASWLVHASMLTRRAESLDVDEAAQMPELFWVRSLKPDASYPFLEMHREGMNRRVWTLR